MDPRRLLPPLAVMALLSVVLTGWVVLRPPPQESAAGVRVAADRPGSAARQTLRAWDAARADAWAAGDVAALRRLYVPGSATGRADVAMLREYVARGLVVEGMQTQVLAVDVLDRTGSRLRMRVTDRLAGGSVVGADGEERGRLPVDRASTRVVTLRRVEGHWRVVEVRAASGG